MIKLLNRPLRVFTLYALIILACSIPVYYFIAEHIWLGELDEHNKTISGQLKENLFHQSPNDSLLDQNIVLWNKLEPSARLQYSASLKPDSAYTLWRENKYIERVEERDRFRGLVSYFTIRDRTLQVNVESNVEETHETIIAITIITIAFFLLLFAGFIFLNRKISGSLWRSFYSTLQKIKEFELNEQTAVQFDKTDIIEFAALNNSLEKLISKDIATFKEQKEFTENASHELQTPLAIIQSKLDILLQSRGLTAEQSGIIEGIEKTLGRISRINRNLLLLAKIGNSQFAEKEAIDVHELVSEQVEMLSDHLIAKNLLLQKEISVSKSIIANRMLAETLVSNLLTNAIRYSDKDNKIIVKIFDDKLTVSNPGKIMLDKEKLFKRFSSQSFNDHGSGLGLSIVSQICARYHWKEEYSYNNYVHNFSVSF